MKPTRIALFVLVPAITLAAGLLPKVGLTVPVLLPAQGAAPDAASNAPAMSGNGAWVAFSTAASNLVPDDPDGVPDIAVVGLRKGQVRCASVSTEGVKGNAASADPALDKAGRRVAFSSAATNLVDADTNGEPDVFVRDLVKGITVRASVASDGTEADGASEKPSISANGRLVVFASHATNLVANDMNGCEDIFLHDMLTGETKRISRGLLGVDPDGDSSLPRISANGRYVAFLSMARNLVFLADFPTRDAFLVDLKTGVIEMISVGPNGVPSNAASLSLAISGNGRRVVFASMGSNLVSDLGQFAGQDIFLRDRKKHTTTLVSAGPGGVAANDYSEEPELSGNGRWVAFTSLASNLVADDTNGRNDVFRRKVKTGETARISVSTQGEQGDSNSGQVSLTRSGRYLAFATRSTNLFDSLTSGEWLIALRRP
ncbi:MAG TPA: hypothetical protein VFY71_10855 [Planctomycetota bacterium]|nr:hypothetical protein [Planctomycetota bacterium]